MQNLCSYLNKSYPLIFSISSSDENCGALETSLLVGVSLLCLDASMSPWTYALVISSSICLRVVFLKLSISVSIDSVVSDSVSLLIRVLVSGSKIYPDLYASLLMSAICLYVAGSTSLVHIDRLFPYRRSVQEVNLSYYGYVHGYIQGI